jgi:hypothetical protein
MGKQRQDSAMGRCDVCRDTERRSVAECICGAVLTVCEECYSQRESAEGGGLLEGCPQCEAEEPVAENGMGTASGWRAGGVSPLLLLAGERGASAPCCFWLASGGRQPPVDRGTEG